MLAGACLLVSVALVRALALPQVHSPLPDAALTSEVTHPVWPDRVRVIRQYQSAADYREVVAWYQGKDSLMPLPAELKPGCFRQSFSRSHNAFRPFMRSRVEEAVKICAAGAEVTITSVTTVRFFVLTP